MADADRANEDVDADEVEVAEPEPEQHRDDEIDSSSDEEDSDEEMEDSDEDSDSDDVDNDGDDDDDSSDEEDVPTPEEVELEYTYPQDFVGRSWEDVVAAGQYFRLIIDPSCITIPYEKFRNCKYLIEIVYPEGKDSKLLRIGTSVFADCCNLQRMNPFPEGLFELNYCAFFNCSDLQGPITIPSSIQYVRGSCFAGCDAITSVVFESSTATTTVLELEDRIFERCRGLRSVRLPNDLTVITRGCFLGCFSLIDVPIPGTVREVRRNAFSGCSSLVSLDFPKNVNAIQNWACADCTSLKTVAIRSSSPNLRVGDGVFNDCPSLEAMKVYPWIFPKLLHAVDSNSEYEDGHLNLMYKFYRKYEHQIALYRQQQQQQQR